MTGNSGRAFLTDGQFWLAMTAAPLVWAALYWLLPMPAGGSGSEASITEWLSTRWQPLLMVVLVYPVLEEIVFRGALQGYLLEKPVLAKPLMAKPQIAKSQIAKSQIAKSQIAKSAQGTGRFEPASWVLTPANLITSLAFTALHFLNHPPMWAALVLFPSLVFGWSRDRFGNIRGCIVLHIFYNAGFFILFG